MKSMKAGYMVLLAGTALAARSTQAADDWTRDFRIGLAVGFNVRADFKMGGQFALGGGNPSGPNYEFNDGYVRVDETGNAQDLTSYWGYQSASQHPTPDTLIFHNATSFSTPTTSQVQRDDSPYVGFDMAYGGTLGRWHRARLGWELGVGLLPITITDGRNLPASFNGGTSTFPVPDIILPQPPYNGGPSGIGPVIGATPLSQTTEITPGTITGTRKLEVMLYNFRLGPTLYWDLHRRWGVSVSAGPALGLVTGDYKFNEVGHPVGGGTIPITGKFGKTDLVYGGYANALALFHLEEHGDLFAGVQFLSLTGTRFSNGAREAKLNMGTGFYLTAGISWPF